MQAESREKLVFTMPRRYHQSENSNLSDIIHNKISYMTKNPLDIIESANDILRALKKGVLVTAKAGDKVNSMVIECGTLGFNWGKPVFGMP